MKEGIRIVINCKSKEDASKISELLSHIFRYGTNVNDDISWDIHEIKEHLISSASYFKK